MILSIHIHLYLLLHDLHDRNKVDTALKIDFAFVDTYNYLQHNYTSVRKHFKLQSWFQ